MGSGQRDVLLEQHGQDLVVVPVGRQDDGRHVHGGGILRVLNPLHQFLNKDELKTEAGVNLSCTWQSVYGTFGESERLVSIIRRRLTAMEGFEDLLGLWLRRMSTAPTTSESIATNKASVA